MTLLVMLVALVVGAIMQAVVPSWAGMGQAKIPVLLAITFYYAIARDHGLMLLAAMIGGLLQDALGSIPLGYSSFCFVLLGEIVSRYRTKIFQDHLFTHMLLGGSITLVVTILLYLMLISTTTLDMPVGSFLLKATGSVLLGLVVVPTVFQLMRNLDQHMGNVRREEF